MTKAAEPNLDYEYPVKIADGIYWIGFYDSLRRLHCNPYLVVDGENAVVIDAGSRPHFAVVMMKILQTGLDPSKIDALICSHFDPDICGSISNFESIIGSKDLKLVSDTRNEMFIQHYSVASEVHSLKDVGYQYDFPSGRRLRFINTPYSHSAGSFITYDENTGVLFTSDLFGSYGEHWDLFLDLDPECDSCADYNTCHRGKAECPIPGILEFHKVVMTSEKALGYALERIMEIPFSVIAPQHGSVIKNPEEAFIIGRKLTGLKGVGIDGVLR